MINLTGHWQEGEWRDNLEKYLNLVSGILVGLDEGASYDSKNASRILPELFYLDENEYEAQYIQELRGLADEVRRLAAATVIEQTNHDHEPHYQRLPRYHEQV